MRAFHGSGAAAKRALGIREIVRATSAEPKGTMHLENRSLRAEQRAECVNSWLRRVCLLRCTSQSVVHFDWRIRMNLKSHAFAVVAASLFVAATIPAAKAQSVDSSVQGVVLDSSSAAVAEADVHLT